MAESASTRWCHAFAFSTLLSVFTAIFMVWRYSHSFIPTESTRMPTPMLSRSVLFAVSSSIPCECVEATCAAACTASGCGKYRDDSSSYAFREGSDPSNAKGYVREYGTGRENEDAGDEETRHLRSQGRKPPTVSSFPYP